MVFFSLCWEVIGPDVIATGQNFHNEGVFEKSYVIPKKGDVVELSDFRTIA